MKFPRNILDLIAKRLGYVPESSLNEDVRVQGHVYAEWYDGDKLVESQYLGKNVFTQTGRIAVAGMIARTTADVPGGVTFDLDEGYLPSDPVFPVKIGVGVGTTAATTEDTALEDHLYVAGSPVYYDLKRVFYSRTVVGYGVNPIGVSFYFEIPTGEVYDTYGTDVDYQEWALVDSTNALLARKVIRFSKLSGLSLILRWELRT